MTGLAEREFAWDATVQVQRQHLCALQARRYCGSRAPSLICAPNLWSRVAALFTNPRLPPRLLLRLLQDPGPHGQLLGAGHWLLYGSPVPLESKTVRGRRVFQSFFSSPDCHCESQCVPLLRFVRGRLCWAPAPHQIQKQGPSVGCLAEFLCYIRNTACCTLLTPSHSAQCGSFD